jgi:hypothetical protein
MIIILRRRNNVAKKKDNIVSLQEMENILGVSFETAPNPKAAKAAKREEKIQAKREEKVRKMKETKPPKEPHYVTIKTFMSLTILFSLLSGAAGAALFSLALSQFFESSNTSSVTGAAGASAYEIAVKNGFKGSEKEWLKSLKGDKGNPGLIGVQGLQGLQGEKGEKGEPGAEAKIQNLTSIPGWPANCSNPKFTQIQIFDSEDVGKFYNILTCD